MKRFISFVIVLATILSVNAFSQNEPEKKYYGIISGSIEYTKPKLPNEEFIFYFEEYGNYTSRYDHVTYISPKMDDFTFTFIFTPDSGRIYFSEKEKGKKVSLIEYPFVYGYDQDIAKLYKDSGKGSALWNTNYRFWEYDKVVLRNMRGFIRILDGYDDEKLEKSMNDRGFAMKGLVKILDRDCILWDNSQNHNKTTIEISTWKGICMRWKEITEGKDGYLFEALKIYEDLLIPFFRFEPPTGMVWEDWPKIL